MAEGIAPLILEIRAKAGEVFTELGKVRSEVKKTADETEGHTTRAGRAFQGMAGAGKAMAIGIAGVAVTVGGAALKMGMDFQESMTSLVTGAGESEKNIGLVSQGILGMAGKVGLSADQLAKGMYLIESAGFHGAGGLKVLQAAAEGARVGNADMRTVADGVTTALSDYGLKASDAATVTSKLVKTVASGKTTMGDLAGSLATVLPIASSAKVGLDQVLGAMATMTAKGTPAADAATYLKQTIAQLSNPTSKAAGEMKALGLNAVDVSSNLGKRGLTGTMDLLTSAIAAKMGPQGTVLIDTLKKGAKSAGGLQSAISKLPPTQQTYVAALADMVGGTKSMQAALMLTGASAGTFRANVKTIGEASTEAGGHVEGFAETQKDLKTKLENAKAGAEAMVTSLGMKLIPVVTAVIGKVTAWGNVLMKHPALLYTIAGVIGTVVVTAITAYIASLVRAGVKSAIEFAKMVASGVAWAASTAAQVASSVASFAVWAAQGIGRAVVAAATGFASMIASAAGWIAQQAVQLAQSAAGFVAWAAEHAIMAASFIAENIAMAASATAAFIAENAATLGIVAAIGLIVAGIVWLATHWKEAWGAITAVAKWAYANVIKPVADWIMNNAIKPIWSAVQTLGSIWSSVWGAIAGVAKRIAGAVAASLGAIVGAIKTVIGWVQSAIGWFVNLWTNADRSENKAREAANTAGRYASQAAADNAIISGTQGAGAAAGINWGAVASAAQHHDVGGWIRGAKGSPQLSVDHGGEYMLSLDMLAGRQPIDPRVKAAIAGPSMSQQALTGGGPSPAAATSGPQVTVIAQTNASAKRIASEVGWQLRAMA